MRDAKDVSTTDVTAFVTDLFAAAGLSRSAAGRVAHALVEADLSGRSSHGILQADGYLARLIHGSMSTAETPTVVSERGGAIVLDAGDMQGHLAAEETMRIAVAKAREFGVAAVAVRNGFHFGVAGRYVRMAAEEGCVGFVMCNTNPVMPAPGGIEKLHGTNPLAIGLPTRQGPPIVLDMASTAGTVGKIRYAAAAGEPIPEGWALDEDGRPTTDASRGLSGTLLPVGGPKGFGLSLVIDLISGLLAGGGWGPHLSTMRGDLDKRYNASYLFIALDIAHFRALDAFLDEAQAGAERVRNSQKAPGTERLFTPGEQSAEAIARSGGRMRLTPRVAESLTQKAQELRVPVPDFLRT